MKIMILGPSGTGKTTVCKNIATKLNVKKLHLDSVYWKSNWGRISKEDFHLYLTDFVRANDSWVIDGNYTNNLHFKLRLDLADVIVYLDYGKNKSLQGIHERANIFKHQVRPDMAPRCFEGIDHVFLNYVSNFDKYKGKYIKAVISNYQNKKRVLIFKTREELYKWYDSL